MAKSAEKPVDESAEMYHDENALSVMKEDEVYTCDECGKKVTNPKMEVAGVQPLGWFAYSDVLMEPQYALLHDVACLQQYRLKRPEITMEAIAAHQVENLKAMSPEDQAAYSAVHGGFRI